MTSEIGTPLGELDHLGDVADELDFEALWLPEMLSGKIRRDSESRDMIPIHGRDRKITVVDPWIAAQVA